MSSSTSSGSLAAAASLFTTTMFVMALSCTAEAFMVRSLADRRRQAIDEDVEERDQSLIGMTVFVYNKHEIEIEATSDAMPDSSFNEYY
jgi:hypothetical protein